MRQFGLIGYPLSHSFSPGYFQEKFEKENITDAQYSLYPIASISEFPSLVASLGVSLVGLNVTIPYKEQVMPFLDAIDPVAAAVGAVNSIHFVDGKSTGYNTDVFGFEMSIKPFLENKYERALIIGTGGASKAVAYALSKWNIATFFLTRKPTVQNHLGYNTLTADTLKHFPLIINTTPLGTFPETDACPAIPYEGLTESHFLYDLVYNPTETLFLQKGKSQGALTMNGMAMLRLQAARSWEIWNA
jgi:shikimate dehydrogenase